VLNTTFLNGLISFFAFLSLVGLFLYRHRLQQMVEQVPGLGFVLETAANGKAAASRPPPRVSVIVPVFNEAGNIEACGRSLLASTNWGSEHLEVWLVDDQSTDDTLAIAQSLQATLADPRLHVVAGTPRPTGETWVGKNWACVQGAAQATGEFLLFLDADVRLRPGAMEAAVAVAMAQQIDLLSCAPAVQCGCLAEWIVQPLMLSTILVGADLAAVNDPKHEAAFAAGPFMLFRRQAYEQIGGHRAVADQVVEDVELARLVKAQGMALRLLPATEYVTVRMYSGWGALWEGWTKNLYMASRRNLRGTVSFAGLILLLCTVPWLVLGLVLFQVWGQRGMAGGGMVIALPALSLAFALIAIALLYDLRRILAKSGNLSTRYWWLSGIGGLVVAAMAIASIIKTETGWGWTWRGRSLAPPPQKSV
jgi:hypothetical protein